MIWYDMIWSIIYHDKSSMLYVTKISSNLFFSFFFFLMDWFVLRYKIKNSGPSSKEGEYAPPMTDKWPMFLRRKTRFYQMSGPSFCFQGIFTQDTDYLQPTYLYLLQCKRISNFLAELQRLPRTPNTYCCKCWMKQRKETNLIQCDS